MSRSRIVSVLVPVAVEAAYSYLVPEDVAVTEGSIVAVPLGPRQVIGAVWDTDPDTDVAVEKLRPIETVFPAPPLGADIRAFVDWVADYTLAAPGMVLRMVLRVPEALVPEPPLKGVRRAGPPPERLTAARKRVLALADNGMAWTKSGLAGAAGVSPSVIEGLVASATLERVDMPAAPPPPQLDPDYHRIELTADQEKAAGALRDAVQSAKFSVSLLDGVTGAGKTEVYFEAIAQALRGGRQVLVLLPEIALTAQFLRRFEERFGARPGEWHSDVPPRQRARMWRQVLSGEQRVVVGARSALFLPFPDLGLIIADEEHDNAYKQEDRVTYNARDMAVVRGHLANFPVVLASATPSLESRVNAERGRYAHVKLPARASGATLPEIHLIDMRADPPERGRWLSPVLVSAIAETLQRDEQVLLFLNRRGYAPLTLCRTCGHRFECRDCSAWLVEHRFRGVLACHHCGHTEPRPRACPSCGTEGDLHACGPGVERVAEEIGALFDDRRLIVLSSDLPGGARRMRQELEMVADGEADIVIGTQLVAKGHNFPKLTLVGVVDADLGLATGDPRAAERTFQLLAQVTGRAGRAIGAGRGYLQTFTPDHPVMRALASGEAAQFYEHEIAARQRAGLPPFGRLASFIVSGPDRDQAMAYARKLANAAEPGRGIDVLGPAEAPLALVRGRHRFRLLVRAARATELHTYIRQVQKRAGPPRGSVRLLVDIDPQSFM